MHDYFKAFTHNVLNYLDEGVYFTDLNKNILYWNSGAETITGYRSEEMINQTCCKIMKHADVNNEHICDEQFLITKSIEEGHLQESFIFIFHKDGYLVPVTLRTFPVYDKEGKIIGFIELITDNSRQKLGQAKMNTLTKAAYIDSLSELYSKQYIENRVQTLLTELPEKRKSFGILYVNITGFRTINERYGVSSADKILKMVAKTLSTRISPPNIIGRWHGASFIVIADTSNKSLLLLLADKLKTLVAESDFAVSEETIAIKVSVGYTISQSYDTLDYIIERATKASLEEKDAIPTSEPPAAMVSNSIEMQQKNRFHSIRPVPESE